MPICCWLRIMACNNLFQSSYCMCLTDSTITIEQGWSITAVSFTMVVCRWCSEPCLIGSALNTVVKTVACLPYGMDAQGPTMAATVAALCCAILNLPWASGLSSHACMATSNSCTCTLVLHKLCIQSTRGHRPLGQ